VRSGNGFTFYFCGHLLAQVADLRQLNLKCPSKYSDEKKPAEFMDKSYESGL
jgi:hypothetical protein